MEIEKIKRSLGLVQRYKNFTFFDTPIPFSQWRQNELERLVQVHSFSVNKDTNEIEDFGFCGAFAWDGGYVRPLDYDSYNRDMKVYAYERFCDAEGNSGLDILVGNDW